MIATRKKFKKEGTSYIETLENYKIGYIFTNASINYRMICENPIIDFDLQIFKFNYSLWAFEPINSVWSWIKNDSIIADKNTWIDAENNKYVDSGINQDSNNAYTYDVDSIKTLKEGLVTEYDAFYDGIFLGIIEPQISASIVDQEMNSITSIV